MILKGLKNFWENNTKVSSLVVITSLAILSFIVTPESSTVAVAEEIDATAIGLSPNATPLEIMTPGDVSTDDILSAIKETEEVEELSITLSSHTFNNYTTEPVTVYPNKLWEAYTNAPADMEFDYKCRSSIINVLWQFLVVEQKVDPVLACAIIGNMSQEGHFAEGQGAMPDLASIEDARNKLGRGGCGYGIIQWTTANRQKLLLDYYEDAYAQLSACKLDGDLWEITKIVAECACLVEEMKAYDVFNDYYDYLTDDCTIEDLIESACGLTCINYIAYRGSGSQWRNTGDSYILAAQYGSGANRLGYALDVYNYYMEKTE